MPTPATVVMLSIVISMGLIALMGWKIQMVTLLLPVLIIAIGTASTMHVVAHHGLEGGETPAEFVRMAMRKVGGAVFLAGLTKDHAIGGK